MTCMLRLQRITFFSLAVASFLQFYYKEILTLFFGIVGITVIIQGSRAYGKVGAEKDEKARRRLLRLATSHILIGNLMMALTAFTAYNPRFFVPEVAATLTALKPFLDTRFAYLAFFFKRVRATWFVVGTALALGIFTVLQFGGNIWQLLPPIGLTVLSMAFGFGNSPKLAKLYRVMTIVGGVCMIVGSLYSFSTAAENTARVMSTAFFLLNFWFTLSEIQVAWKQFRR
mgnify:CR=1 FL=1